MKKSVVSALVCSLLFAASVAVSAAVQPRRDILGVRLGMSKADAHAALGKVGSLRNEERKRQEVWDSRDPKFSGAIVGYDKAGVVRFVTAVARSTGERMRYADVGDLKKARQAGNPAIKNFRYEWVLPAAGGAPKMVVEARGRDPKYLETYSIRQAY